MTKNRKYSGEFIDFDELRIELSKALITLKVGKEFQEKNKNRQELSAQYIESARAETASLEQKIQQLEAILATEPPPPELPPRKPLFKASGVLGEFSVQKVMGYFTDREYDPEEFARQEASDQVGSLLLAIAGNVAGSAVTGQSNIRKNDACDFVRGKINGIPFHGWLGQTHVREGDYVEMAVAEQNDHYVVYAIMLPILRTISITPRCNSGREAEINFGKGCGFPAISSVFLAFLVVLHFMGADWRAIAFGAAIFAGMLLLAFWRTTNSIRKKPGPVILLTENIFTTLGFAEPRCIDLQKITKKRLKQQTEDTPAVTDREMPFDTSYRHYFYYY
ncbi:putative type VI secretion system effector [Rahnella aquatilis]|uniref:putative type VI secretion system effector n=1 Tax=Rahnella aquatilis TaxID=34038 RepID=UPI0006461D91